MSEVNNTSSSEMNLSERISRLEKQVVRISRIAWVIGAILLVVVTLGAISTQEETKPIIRTRNLEIVDEKGNTRINLTVLESYPDLIMYDNNGKNRVEFRVFEEGPSLSLSDKDGNTRASLYVNEKPMLMMNGKGGYGNPRIRLSVAENDPILLLNGENNTPSVVLSVGKENPNIIMYDEDEKIRFRCMVYQDHPSMFMFDKNGSPTFSAP